MLVSSIAASQQLAELGLSLPAKVHYQSSPEELVQDTLRLKEGVLSDSGALVIHTGKFTGRSPRDKFIVRDPFTTGVVDWNEFNSAISEEQFEEACAQMKHYFEGVDELWARDGMACADKRFRLNLRVIAEKPWAAYFAHNMFIRPQAEELQEFQPDWQIFVAPGLELNPGLCGTRNPNATIISFRQRMIIVAGSGYTGEIKKGIFTVLNLVLPQSRSVLSMHCSANMGENGETALFFGLSGTGKTTLSADPARLLIGDDEHGWTRDNIFNFEGGCYAKVINLNPEVEPDIFAAIRPGALVENTVFKPASNRIDFSSSAITENTRVSYPIHFIANSAAPSIGNIPSHIFFLTCDAYGVLPPISRLTPAQAMYQFICGYTAKIAGTEAGINEPVSTFSACFGAPFLPLHPTRYAKMLGEKIRQHKVCVWLVNTGWSGGPYGIGSRIPLKYTRSMISAALSKALDKVPYDKHPVFDFDIPVACPGVPSVILYPRDTWSDKDAYDAQAAMLAKKFRQSFEKYAAGADEEVKLAGPRTE